MNVINLKNGFKGLVAFVYLQIHAINSFAQRVTSEDIYGESSGGEGGFLGSVGLIIFSGFIVCGFISNKGFRLGVLAYAAFLGGLLLIFKSFGKDAGVVACVVAIIILWFMDPSNKDKN